MKYRVSFDVDVTFWDAAEEAATADARAAKALAEVLTDAVYHGDWDGYSRDNRTAVYVHGVDASSAQKMSD